MEKEDFDRFTKGPDSPAKSHLRYIRPDPPSQYDPTALIPHDYDEKMMLQKEKELAESKKKLAADPFAKLGVSNEDKMTFFLLKWVFNAIKRESSIEDLKLKGRNYVTK